MKYKYISLEFIQVFYQSSDNKYKYSEVVPSIVEQKTVNIKRIGVL